jgi:hypothetical protein
MDVEHALFDQETVDGGIEVTVVLHVVDVTVNVIVHPARGDDLRMAIIGAHGGLLPSHLNVLKILSIAKHSSTEMIIHKAPKRTIDRCRHG